MSEIEQIKSLQDELDRKDRIILDMRLALIESRLAQLDDHELRLRAVEQKAVESRTILTLAFGTGLLSLGNLITMWVR
ncbi:MAG TPA: hypothetical protein VIU39_14415 [Anaerolineales bacterium]